MNGLTKSSIRALAVVIGAALLTLLLGRFVLGATPSSSSLPAEKRALLEREDALRDQTQVRPKPASPERPRPSIPNDARWPTGIFADGEFPSSEYRFLNRWNGLVGGRHVTVYAGSDGADLARGLVLVMSVSIDLEDVAATAYPVAGVKGPLRIVSVKGTTLDLLGAEGSRVAFDVVSRRFASS